MGTSATSPIRSDKAVALNYAAALRRLDRIDQAVAVLQKAAIDHPNDREVLAAYGKALAAGGDFERALAIIQRAQTPDQPDWRLLSAEAAIRDQTRQARRGPRGSTGRRSTWRRTSRRCCPISACPTC